MYPGTDDPTPHCCCLADSSCQVLVGPHMDNFADIVHQLQHQGLAGGDVSTRALRELPTTDVSGLVAALRSRLLSPVDGEAQQQQTRTLATLASVSLSTHERRLREWLAGRQPGYRANAVDQ